MSRHCYLLVLCLCWNAVLHAQWKLTGKITNDKLEPLPLVSIQVKDAGFGTVSREDGTFQLKLDEGDYVLVISMVGFKTQFISLVINKDYVQNIILESNDAVGLEEVVIRGKVKDRSEEIIRQVIRHKEALLAAPGAWSCEAYIKAIQIDSIPPKAKSKKAIDSTRSRFREFDGMSMAEIALRYDHENDLHTKETRTGVVKRGNPDRLFFLSLTEGNFNLYNNLLKIPGLSEVPFLSPISYSGLNAYKFKVIQTEVEHGKKVYTISIRPRQLSNVTIAGEVRILDSAWVVLSAHYTLPGFHVPEYDRFEVDQTYSLVGQQAWMITRQQFTYYSKHGKGKQSGETTIVYNHFELNRPFPKKYFGTELSATSQQAYERDSSFWTQTRTEPLTSTEIKFIQYRDSIYRVTNSKAYLDSVDAKLNKVTWKKVLLLGQSFYNREKKRRWTFAPVSAMIAPFNFGGMRLETNVSYFREFASKKTLSVFTDLSYGFRNQDINGSINLTRMYNPFNRAYYHVEAGRDFAYIFEGDAWINALKRNNQYLNNNIGFGHGQEMVNGLYLYTDVQMALRRSLAGYRTGEKIDELFPDLLGTNQAINFQPYNAFYGQVKLQYTPFQKYIREPREKIILGSNWPSVYVSWRKGIPGIFNSKVDFDYLEFGLHQELKLGTTGVSHYSIKTGSFLTRKDLRYVDYKFQRRGDPWLFLNPDEAFQALDSTFPVFHRFYQAHYVHEFNGAILNKIPFLKKLELREVAGGGFLYAKERNLRYGEVFAGVEKVFKWPFNPLYKFKMGVYVVGSAANQFRNPVQLKIGLMSWDMKRNKWQ